MTTQSPQGTSSEDKSPRFTERQKRFAALLENEEYRRDLFNDHYFDALVQRHAKFIERAQKVQIVQTTIALLLVLTLLSIHASVSFLGISVNDAYGIRELLLLVSSSIQLIHLVDALDDNNVAGLLGVRAELLSKGNADISAALRLSYGLGGSWTLDKIVDLATLGKLDTAVFLASTVGMFGWLLIGFGFAITVQIAAAIDVLAHPTISLRFSVLVVSYVVLVDVTALGLYRLNTMRLRGKQPAA